MIARRAVTMIEILVAVAITGMILAAASMLLTSTRREVRRGSDIIQSQVLIERIVANLRTDVRSLRYLRDLQPQRIEMEVLVDGNLETLKYEYVDGVIIRTLSGTSRYLNAAGEILELHFEPRPDLNEFRFLEMSLRVSSDKDGPDNVGRGSNISIVSHFFPYCREEKPLFGRNP